MKITLTEQEMLEILKKSFPLELLPPNSRVTDITIGGYPQREFTIIISKEEDESGS